MPVEIRELIIKAVVSGTAGRNAGRADSTPQEKDKLLSECVEETLQIIKEKQER